MDLLIDCRSCRDLLKVNTRNLIRVLLCNLQYLLQRTHLFLTFSL